MPIRDRITWGDASTLSDPRLAGLDELVVRLREGRNPPSVKGARVFENRDGDLPAKEPGYYREFDVEVAVKGVDRGKLRLVLGKGGEVYLTGNHYRDFRQVINLPNDTAESRRAKLLKKLEDARTTLQAAVDRSRSAHRAQQKVLTDTSTVTNTVIGTIGFWTNRAFGNDLPELIIWNVADGRLASARRAIREENVKAALRDLVVARGEYLLANAKFVRWLNGRDGSAAKMQLAIAVVALVIIAGLITRGASAPATGTVARLLAAEQSVEALAVRVAAGEAEIALQEAAIIELEASVEAAAEAEEFFTLLGL